MATGSTNASPSNSTDALFRGLATAVSNGFSNSGWVQTGDTGQINLTTVTRPLAANTSMGYQIWRMADTLQSTKPVFVKIEYGSSGATNRPAET